MSQGFPIRSTFLVYLALPDACNVPYDHLDITFDFVQRRSWTPEGATARIHQTI